MSGKLFISYSRAQTPFVDRLASGLEERGYSLWLDYQDLVPARPWFEQIQSWIDAAAAVLLVVSREAIESKNVEPEWKRAVERGQRVILLIFEAVPLPPELQSCEWVDFRGDYPAALQQLVQVIERPAPPSAAVPQSGFKAPPVFWVSLALSIVVLIGSIPAWWTLALPLVLIPLPLQLVRRNYVFHRVIPALLALPLVYGLTWWMMFSTGTSVFHGLRGFAAAWFPLSWLAGWLLAALLFTPDMQRRGRPEAARLRFASPIAATGPAARPVHFVVDHSPEDARYGESLRRALEESGHRQAEAGAPPEAAFVLMSAYKKETALDPDREAVYPVLLQAAKGIAPGLQRIQWIDFRGGIGSIRSLARLLPEPEHLLRGLAVPPAGSQEVYPLAVTVLQYFTLVTGLLQGGGLLLSLLALLIWALRGNPVRGAEAQIVGVMLSGALLLGTMRIALHALRSRAGGAAGLYPLLVLNIFQISVSFSSMLLIAAYWQQADLEAETRLLGMATRASAVNGVVLPAAVLGVVAILAWRWAELYRWLPQRRDTSVSQLESWLLLYTPSRPAALVLHIVFHGLSLLLYALLNAWSLFAGSWLVPYLVFCCGLVILLMVGIRAWARRLAGPSPVPPLT